MKTFSLALAATLFAGASAQSSFDYTATPTGSKKCALINVVMDESGSMYGDQEFMKNTALPRMSTELHSASYGYDHVLLCSTGFTNSASTRYSTTTYARDLGCTVIEADGTIKDANVVDWNQRGHFEDGWHAMMTAIDSVPSTIDTINLLTDCGRIDKNLILVTDEDRDNHSSDTVTQVKLKISASGYVLNCIVNILIDSSRANLGMKIEASETESLIFEYDSAAGTYSNFTKTGYYRDYVSDFGTTHADYSELIVGTNGAVWNINALRAGGDLTQAFADAFVQVKVEEIAAGCSRCENGPALTPAPSVAPSVSSVAPPTGTNGDPHFKTWKHEHFEFHGQCDMILAKDPKFANGVGLDVQIRTKMVRFWSYIHTAAVRIGDDILEIHGSADDEDHDTHYWFNFQYQADTTTVGGFPLIITSNGAHKRYFEIDLSSKFPGQKIVLSAFKEFVAVDFKDSTTESFGNAVGMLGDYKTGKTFARDGVTEIDDFNVLGNEWQLLPSDDMLFHDKAEPQYPKRCILPEDPQGQRRRRLDESSISVEKAEAICATLKDPLSIKDCVYDILATQDLDMVGAF